MRIAPAPVPSIPSQLAKTLGAAAAKTDVPGLIVQADLVPTAGPNLRRALDALAGRQGASASPFVVVKPQDVSLLFRYEKELGLLKTILKAVTHDAAPHISHGIDAVWLVYGGLRFREMLKAPERDTAACFWELLGLGVETVKVAGDCFDALKLPDAYANGMNYLVTSGSSVSAGKTVPVMEMMASRDERNAVPLAVLKAIGYSFDGPPTGLLNTALQGGSPRPSLVPLGSTAKAR